VEEQVVEEQQVEEEAPEDLMHPVFFRTTREGSSSIGMYESEDEPDGEEGDEGDEGEEGGDGEEGEEGEEWDDGDDGEVDLRRWNAPEEGEEFVEPDPVLRLIEPGSRRVYCRGVSTLPDVEDWHKSVGEKKIVLIATGAT
jgi:hypothetical protein